MSGWLFALLEQASHMFDVMIMWTGLVFPSRLLSLSCIYTHTDDPLISLYIFFFVAVRGVGLVRWFFALFFSSKKEKKPISGLAPSDHTHTHTHCGTYQIVIDPADSSLFVSSSSFFSFLFFSLPQLLRSSWVWGSNSLFPVYHLPIRFFFFWRIVEPRLLVLVGLGSDGCQVTCRSMSVFVLRLLNSFVFPPNYTYKRVESFKNEFSFLIFYFVFFIFSPFSGESSCVIVRSNMNRLQSRRIRHTLPQRCVYVSCRPDILSPSFLMDSGESNDEKREKKLVICVNDWSCQMPRGYSKKKRYDMKFCFIFYLVFL